LRYWQAYVLQGGIVYAALQKVADALNKQKLMLFDFETYPVLFDNSGHIIEGGGKKGGLGNNKEPVGLEFTNWCRHIFCMFGNHRIHLNNSSLEHSKYVMET
jgi:hypothetical protein